MPHRTALILLLAAFAVAGCGRKGSLEDPGSAPVADSMLPDTVLGTIARPATPKEPTPPLDKPFVLDPLI